MASKARLLEDRALRDATRRVLDEDLSILRSDTEKQSVGSRLGESGAHGAREAADAARNFAEENPGAVASALLLALAALVAWIFRDRVAKQLHALFEPSADEAEQVPATARSQGSNQTHPGD